MVADKGKKAKVAPEEEALVVDDALLLSIEKLQEVQDDLEKINEKASDEVLELEQKYSVVRRPIYVERNDVIKTIPDFWLTAFMSHPALCDCLNEEDGKIFKYLESLDVADFKDLKLGYSITFNFNENPYFEDTKLVKTFKYSEDGTTSTTATNIKWKKNMAAAVNGVGSEKNGKKRSLDSQSFFSWFNEADFVDLQDEVGEIIKEDLWPNPLKYFNDAGGDDDDDDSNDEQDDDSNDEQDDDEEDSADDDDEPEE